MSGYRGTRAHVARLTAALVVCVAPAFLGCAGDFNAGVDPGLDGGFPDAPSGCLLGISYTPTNPVAGVDPIVRAVAQVSGASAGAPTYSWVLLRNGVLMATPAPATADNSEVEFSVNDAIYTIAFSLSGEPACLQASEVIDVNPQGVGTIAMRVHVVSPDPARPPLVKNVTVEGGAQDLIDSIQLEPAVTFDGHLELAGAPVAGYVRFMPGLGGEAAVETYANALGDFQIKVRPETHDVLVVPTTPGVPPQIVTWQQQPTLTLGAGQTVTGVVNRPNGTPLANASVQLTIGPPGATVPSTVGVTNGSGAFSLVVMPQTGAIVRIEVTAPAASGLPRLIAQSTSFDPAMPITVSYDPALTTRSLDGTIISRGGGLASANVSIVGTVAAAGSIRAGATQVANGEVRFSATTNGSGALPPTLFAPAAQLSAVIFPAGAVGDHAVTPIDLRTSVPGTINAAATVAKSTQLRESTNVTALPGAVLDAVPTGDLALAGAPTIRKTADASGNLTIDLAPNGTYQLRLSDPNGNRAALAVSNATTATNITTLPLSKATRVQGLVLGQAAISGAVVQLLCSGTLCQGLERSRPVAQGITGVDGRFSLAVPDPD